jgi:hypothetical protein
MRFTIQRGNKQNTAFSFHHSLERPVSIVDANQDDLSLVHNKTISL